MCEFCHGEQGDKHRSYRLVLRKLRLQAYPPPEAEIERCGHDHDPGDQVCGECGAQLWSQEDYESAMRQGTVKVLSRLLEMVRDGQAEVVSISDGGVDPEVPTHETIIRWRETEATVECSACGGWGKRGGDGRDAIRCDTCDGTGKVPAPPKADNVCDKCGAWLGPREPYDESEEA